MGRTLEKFGLDHPEGVLETKYGKVNWRMGGPNGVAFFANDSSAAPENSLVINGVFYTLRTEYSFYKNCGVPYWRFEYFHLSRVDAFRNGKWNDSATPAAIKAMRDELIKCWEKTATPEIFKQAALYEACQMIERIEGEIEDIEDSLVAKRVELVAAYDNLEKVKNVHSSV